MFRIFDKLKTFKRIILFLISGGTAATFQLLVYVFLSRSLNFQYLYASSIAFVSALILSFILQKFVTFSNINMLLIPRQFFLFSILAVFNLGMNILFMYAFIEIIGIHDIFAQATTMVVIAIWSFFIYQKFIFFHKDSLSGHTTN